MASYGGPGREPNITDLDLARLFGRGGNGADIELRLPSGAGKLFGLGAALVALVVLLKIGVGIYTDWLWFESLGFAAVYLTRISAQVYTFLAFGTGFLLLLTANLWLARRFHKSSRVTVAGALPDVPQGLVRAGWGLAIGIQALIMASVAGGFWSSLLRFASASPFGVRDALLQQDVGFYVFRLPVYRELQVWLLWAFVLVLVNVAIAHGLGTDFSRLRTNRAAAIHLSVVGSVLLALVAWNYQLDIYGLLFSTRGVTEGASYTDVHVQYGAYRVLTIVTGLAAVALIGNLFIRKVRLLVGLVGVWLLTLILGGWAIPAFVQQFQVKPNELNLERQYIANNIEATRQAFNLDKVEVQDFNVQDQVTQQDAARDQATIKNIRLLDYRPLQTTYNQIQSIRQYYDFPDIDVDRYTLNGEYQQVILGVRELDTSRLSPQAQTWVNLHLQYTHGYGVAMSPVAQVTAEGLPVLLEQDLPPKGVLSIARPEVYYGTQTKNWVIVNTKQQEFDFPQGDQNVFSTYAGSSGVKLDNLAKRLAFAWRFADLNIVITNSLTADSKILFNRLISERLAAVAPFLTYDRDPYLVVDGGRMYWIQDAYTTTSDYPYSQATNGFNYIRNAVKVVIDAYDGSMSFYLADASDPLILTYQKIFPELFRPIADMPSGLRAHVRYPEDMFQVQAEMYQTYHMTDPQVLYNREDLWARPLERGAQSTNTTGTALQAIQPYYVLMRLPGETQTEFLLLLPFTPATKSNMISWLGARSDGTNYGKLLDYRLPKDKLIYGPQQIESRIDQDPTISGQLTLWNQQGSQVIRGNLLAIPVGQSFLFVEPLYLQSQSSPLPELKRVIVANGNRIAMAETLDLALSQVFSGTATTPGGVVSTLPPPSEQPATTPRPAAPVPSVAGTPATSPAGLQPLPNVPPAITDLAREANDHSIRAQEALRTGNFTLYAQEITAVQQDLQRLAQLSGASQ